MDWLDVDSRAAGPPRLPGLPDIPPMPVVVSEAPAPTNQTIEVEPQWLELVEERRAKNAQQATTKAPRPAAPAAATKKQPAPPARPRVRPIIPREDE